MVDAEQKNTGKENLKGLKRMKKLTKKQINMIAIIHAASVLRETDFFMFDEDSEICSEDQYKIIQRIGVISERLADGHPTNLGSTENIVEYVKSRT